MNTTNDNDFAISEKNWFEEENINLVEEKLEANLKKLFNYENYSKLSDNFSEINLKLLSSLDENQRNLFYSYQNTALALNSYQNALAYYLGLNEK